LTQLQEAHGGDDSGHRSAKSLAPMAPAFSQNDDKLARSRSPLDTSSRRKESESNVSHEDAKKDSIHTNADGVGSSSTPSVPVPAPRKNKQFFANAKSFLFGHSGEHKSSSSSSVASTTLAATNSGTNGSASSSASVSMFTLLSNSNNQTNTNASQLSSPKLQRKPQLSPLKEMPSAGNESMEMSSESQQQQPQLLHLNKDRAKRVNIKRPTVKNPLSKVESDDSSLATNSNEPTANPTGTVVGSAASASSNAAADKSSANSLTTSSHSNESSEGVAGAEASGDSKPTKQISPSGSNLMLKAGIEQPKIRY
jgi:hypothetical protein